MSSTRGIRNGEINSGIDGQPNPDDPVAAAAERERLADERDIALTARETRNDYREALQIDREARTRRILAGAQTRDENADERDARADRRDLAASRVSFLSDNQTFRAALSARQSAATDRVDSKADRSSSAADRTNLSNEADSPDSTGSASTAATSTTPASITAPSTADAKKIPGSAER